MFQVKHINQQIVLGILDFGFFSKSNPQFSKRILEKKGSQFVVQKLLNSENIEIGYNQEGRPILPGRTEHISISHSHDRLVVILNKERPTGCDIELIRDKVQLVQHKFLNDFEKASTNNDTEKLIIYWAAKETLYKIYGLKGLDFKENIGITNFDNNKIIGKITINDYIMSYLLSWEKLGNYILVYSLNEI